ncbi:NAD(P)-binding domain protein [Cordyceps fumosorosea ARSEF 2679]|uniref:NAD(P)-binding domain protein n=1 Tax=Cordyceps fumosorosea (strain ARSEF 2679) TaxID=1081104 RepID=A0A168BN25_CORFA|nr:NAD(P)-binding domain protein [Cordyceps fumosorosea ARSEF 2679]OAA70327.1 NAD(P)-binding domain protein [Cordyceps fumosorosea ARSEF 2679]
MTLTVLSDDQVNSIFESLDLEELEEFRHVLASALHEFSTGSQVDGADAFQQPHRITTQHPETKATTLYMPSCGPEGMGCKVVSLTTSAAMQDPSVKPISPTGVVNLFSPGGELTGVVHASSLTAFRTALASACLVARRNHVRDIVVFGSGAQAYWHVRLALMMRGATVRHVHFINHRFSASAGLILKKFSVIPQDVKAREGWAEAKFSLLTPSFHEFDRLQKEHLRAADVVYCCTPSRADLFDAHILTSHEGRRKGRLIVAVGSFTPEMRELPEALLHQVTKQHDRHHDKPHRHFHKHAEEGGVIVVDTLEGVLKEAGEIIAAKIPATHLVELGELVMLHRLRVEESEAEASASDAASDFERTDTADSGSAMSGVYGSQAAPPPRPASPASSTSSAHKSTFHLPFRTKSGSSSSDQGEKKKKEDHMVRWLRDGTVVYKSVGLGLMDLVVGTHLINVATKKNIGTRIEGF